MQAVVELLGDLEQAGLALQQGLHGLQRGVGGGAGEQGALVMLDQGEQHMATQNGCMQSSSTHTRSSHSRRLALVTAATAEGSMQQRQGPRAVCSARQPSWLTWRIFRAELGTGTPSTWYSSTCVAGRPRRSARQHGWDTDTRAGASFSTSAPSR